MQKNQQSKEHRLNLIREKKTEGEIAKQSQFKNDSKQKK